MTLTDYFSYLVNLERVGLLEFSSHKKICRVLPPGSVVSARYQRAVLRPTFLQSPIIADTLMRMLKPALHFFYCAWVSPCTQCLPVVADSPPPPIVTSTCWRMRREDDPSFLR